MRCVLLVLAFGANLPTGFRQVAATDIVKAESATRMSGLSEDCQVGKTCRVKQSVVREEVRPCQTYVGYGWVIYKYYKDLTEEGTQPATADTGSHTPLGKKDMQKYLDKEVSVPIILGPGGIPYAIDSHHTLSSIDYWASISGKGDKVKVTLDILCDKSSLTMQQFESYLMESNSAFLLVQDGPDGLLPPNGTKVGLADLPGSIKFPADEAPSLPNSIWRSLAAFSRKVPKSEKGNAGWCPDHVGGSPSDRYCLRCYMRICNEETGGGIPYFEFMWGYFFNEMYRQASLWMDSTCGGAAKSDWLFTEGGCTSLRQSRVRYLVEGDFGSALTKQSNILRKKGGTTYNFDTWSSAVMEINPSCRNAPAKDFVMPSHVASQFGRSKLPGVASSPYEMLPSDPSCKFLPPNNC